MRSFASAARAREAHGRLGEHRFSYQLSERVANGLMMDKGLGGGGRRPYVQPSLLDPGWAALPTGFTTNGTRQKSLAEPQLFPKLGIVTSWHHLNLAFQ